MFLLKNFTQSVTKSLGIYRLADIVVLKSAFIEFMTLKLQIKHTEFINSLFLVVFKSTFMKFLLLTKQLKSTEFTDWLSLLYSKLFLFKFYISIRKMKIFNLLTTWFCCSQRCIFKFLVLRLQRKHTDFINLPKFVELKGAFINSWRLGHQL